MNVSYKRQNPDMGMGIILGSADFEKLQKPFGWLREEDVLPPDKSVWLRLMTDHYHEKQVHGNHALLTSTRLDIFLLPGFFAGAHVEIPHDRIYSAGLEPAKMIPSYFGRIGGIVVTLMLSDTPTF